MDAPDEDRADADAAAKLVRNEQRKLTATYLNVVAGSFFTAGVAAPIAAAVFGIAGSGAPIGTLTVVVGTTIFVASSVTIHFVARTLLRSLEP